MSAPNQGRQSPDPEQQTDKQQSTPADGHIGAAQDSAKDSKSASEDTKQSGLSSNPEHPLDKHAEAKASKDGRGPGV